MCTSLSSANLGGTGTLGYRRPGGLRPAATAELPGHGRHPNVLQHRFAGLAGQHSREVDTGSESEPRVARGQRLINGALGAPLLPERAHHSGGQQEGPAQRPADHPRPRSQQAGAGQAGAGTGHCRANWCLRISRVLRQDQGGMDLDRRSGSCRITASMKKTTRYVSGHPRGLRESHSGGSGTEEEEEEAVQHLVTIPPPIVIVPLNLFLRPFKLSLCATIVFA